MTVIILVGTETGNSLDYATRASEDLERFGVESEIYLMDEFPLENLLDASTLIFVCSTTGDGEEPGNMKKFMKFLLRADLPGNLFAGIGYAVFGLGDSSYDKFNYVGKRVYRRMQQLGGRDLVGFRGEGDERSSKGIEGGWTVWWEKLVDKMKKEHSVGGSVLGELEPTRPRCSLKFISDANVDNSDSRAFEASILSCSRVTPLDHFQDTRLLKFKLTVPSDSPYKFLPGDIMNLKPSNDPRVVQEVLDLMGWDGDGVKVYGIEGKFAKNWDQGLPRRFPMSLRQLLTHWVDLSRVPSRSALKTLACLCNVNAAEYSLMHQEKLVELSREEGEYLEYVWRPKRSIVEILKDFQPTLRIGLDRILQVFTPIKARQFSIANDPDEKGIFELLVALVKEDLPLGRGVKEGLCSQWIKSERINHELSHVTISHGSLNPKLLKRVVFLFATGTGIAPLRSVIQRLKHTDTKIYLYFGCRSLEKDFYFKEEWETVDNLTVFAAGSRDKSGPRVYLNDVIKANSGPLLNYDVNEITCMVAGHSRLNKLVQDTLNEIWKDKALVDGKSWVEWLKSHGQYQTETWS